ncbi:SIS domain-containing protein [Nonomuraea sp. NPDC049141]|uniref:D-sedoheptulose-7-phosphate isomerase n=1 Tax=Nonomuraea sp. NPDC049141 TaxID=3155500 RepID=UPI0033DC2C1D
MTDALYPFLSSAESDAEPLLTTVTRSTVEKAREIVALRREVLTLLGPGIAACGQALAEAFAAGGRLFTFGNGGSSTDAQAVAHLFFAPERGPQRGPGHGLAHRPGDRQHGLPAISLTADVALLTALANDIGFDAVFARQLAALGTAADIAMGISTSGGSLNVVRGLQEAKHLGMVTVGLAGSGGGQLAECGAVDHLLVIPSPSVHRIQEAQATVCHVLWESVRRALDETA